MAAKPDSVADARVRPTGAQPKSVMLWSIVLVGVLVVAYGGFRWVKERGEKPVEVVATASPGLAAPLPPLATDLPPPAAGKPEPLVSELYVEIQTGNEGIRTLLASQSRQDEKLNRIERSVASLQATFDKQIALAKAPPPPTRPVKASAPQAKSELGVKLLAVDIWGGKPSAVVGTGRDSDRRVAFLAAGDQQASVTVKSIDSAAQSAVLSHGGRDVRLSRED